MPKLPRDNSDSSLHEKYKESDTKRRKRMGRGGAGNDNDKKKNLIEYNYDESSESDESDDECMFTGPVTRNRAKGLTSNRSLPPKTKRPRMEMDDDEEEDEEEPTEEEEAEDEEQEDEMEDDEDEEASGLPPGTSLQINIGSFQDKSAAMVPKRHDLKKEPEQVKRFVELVNKPIEEIGIDAQIDHFKSMDSVHQEQLLDALERRPTATDTGAQLMFRILTMKISPELQAMALAKYQALQNMDPSTSEYFKQRAWLDKLCSMPFGNYRDLPVQLTRDGPDQCATFIQNARACLDKSVFGQDEAKLQVLQWMANKIANPEANGKSLLLVGPAGCGKCHAKDTPILMANGTIKMVQDIIVGDYIMGDDSKPRQVLSLGQGKDMMYDVIPVKGEKYTVNSEHILCLKQSGRGAIKVINRKNITYKTIRIDNINKCIAYKTFKTYDDAEDYLNSFTEEDNIIEISVKDYLLLSNDMKKMLKGYSKGVEFPYIEPLFDPYIIGLWLGDGSSDRSSITSQDAEIINYLQKNLPQYNLMLSYYSQYDYRIRAIYKGKKNNVFLEVLKQLNMLNNKHIPDHFKCNSRDVRLKLLAGLIDTDGYVNNNTVEITQKNTRLADDIVYLARSLGFAAYCRDKKSSWTYKGVKNTDNYKCITISGNTSDIPIRIKRKIPNIRTQIKDVLVTGISIKEVGYGDYFGFTIDGNNRYLMGNFTVTHNTSLIKNGIAQALGWPFQFISLGGDSDASTYTGHQLVYESSHPGKIVNSLIGAKSMSMILMFDEVDKISTTPKGEEVQNLLVHLTDPVQNSLFEDKYLAGVPIDLSKVMFIFSANNISKIDRILLDRMNVIQLKGYSAKEKLVIAENYLLPEALQEVALTERVSIPKDVLEHLINVYASDDTGVRELKRCIEAVVQKINMLRMYNSKELPFYIKDFSLPFIVKREHVELFLKKRKERDDGIPFGMYI